MEKGVTAGSHYGHMDFLLSHRAQEEVFPHVGAWLDSSENTSKRQHRGEEPSPPPAA